MASTTLLGGQGHQLVVRMVMTRAAGAAGSTGFLIGALPSMLCCRDRLKLHPDLRGRAAAHARGVRVEVEVQKEITTLISVDVQKEINITCKRKVNYP